MLAGSPHPNPLPRRGEGMLAVAPHPGHPLWTPLNLPLEGEGEKGSRPLTLREGDGVR